MGQGAQVLLEGRFRECERLAGDAARLAPAEAGPALLTAVARREQGRASEAEVLVRAVLAEHPDLHEGHALLGAVLADLGRDGEVRRQLDLLRPPLAPAVAALVAEAAAALGSTEHAEASYDALAGEVAAGGAGWHGPPARYLGLACHVLGRWYEAEAHFQVALDASQAAGAPVVLAHVRRQYSALLRARGDDGDWEQAIDLLAGAAAVYRRLDIARLVDEAEAVLRRSQDHERTGPDDGPDRFVRAPAGWELWFRGRPAVVADVAGLGHIATLLAAAGRPVHALELVHPTAGDVEAEYRARLAAVDGDLRAGTGDPGAAALGRAEHDLLSAELDTLTAGPGPDPAELARRLVALRLRTAFDCIEGALPELARHLCRSIRTGTFCLYEPERPARWKIGP